MLTRTLPNLLLSHACPTSTRGGVSPHGLAHLGIIIGDQRAHRVAIRAPSPCECERGLPRSQLLPPSVHLPLVEDRGKRNYLARQRVVRTPPCIRGVRSDCLALSRTSELLDCRPVSVSLLTSPEPLIISAWGFRCCMVILAAVAVALQNPCASQ